QYTDSRRNLHSFPTRRSSDLCERIGNISNQAKTIKLADLIDNTSSIVQYDKGFAVTYLNEKRYMLNVLEGGYKVLLIKAQKVLRSEEHTSELQSRENLVCRLL